MLSGSTGASSRLGQCAAHSTCSPPKVSPHVAALKTRHDLHGKKISYRIGPGPEDKKYEITRAEQEQITEAIDKALDQRTLTREELAREIVKRTKLRPILQSHLLSGFGSLLQQAAHQGSLIFRPSEEAKVTFTRPDQWRGRQDQPSSKQALKTLLRQFYATYGPASFEDFAHWWGGFRRPRPNPSNNSSPTN